MSLQPGEVLCVVEGIPHICYYRPAPSDGPLAVFLPGGGHLARVAYGHPGATPSDFIDTWLAAAGYGLLALSYPSDHPAFVVLYPDLTLLQWASSAAQLIEDHLRQFPCREVVMLGWSMAGRSVVAIERALHARGVSLNCFISLAATAPLPNMFPDPSRQEHFTPAGFWDSSTRHSQWLAQIETQRGASGAPAIDPASYLAHYVVNSPFALRVQPQQDFDEAEAALADEAGAFAYDEYPPVAAIIPESSSDGLHALTDAAVWGAINALRIARRIGPTLQLDATRWTALQSLATSLPQRLCRSVPGGHFFFIGHDGAAATVHSVVELANEWRALDAQLHALLKGE